MKTHVKNNTSEHAQSRPRDSGGRFPQSPKPSLSEILATFGDSWRSWRTLARAIEPRLSKHDERLSSLDSNEKDNETRASKGGTQPLANGEGTLLHCTRNTIFDNDFDFDFYRQCTGRDTIPKGPVKELWIQSGRGSGKTRFSSALLVHKAVQKYDTLAPGERAKCFLIAQNRQTARQAYSFTRGIIKQNKTISRMVIAETKSSISLNNNVDIEIVSASFKHVRGFSVVCAILDEIAFYWISTEAANSDREIINAIRPGLARVPNSLLLAISSPHSARGALYESNRKYFGNNESDSVLFWLSKTKDMNPQFDADEIKRAFEEDPGSAKTEYDAEFKKESESFISAEMYDACVATDRQVLTPSRDKNYVAFVDTAGGSGSDSTALSIGHIEQNKDDASIYFIDVLVERKPPFDPAATLEELSMVLKEYRITTVYGDRFAGSFPKEAFSKSGIKFVTTDQSKSNIYQAALPLLTSGKVELLDKPRLRNQMINLERKSTTGGRVAIDHARSGHDDTANAVAGCIVHLSLKGVKTHGTREKSGHLISVLWPSGDQYFCRGKDINGRCIPGKFKRAKPQKDSSYALSDKLWAELERS